MNKIRKGDEVVVITGREKGRRGTVIKVLPNERVLVENVNMVKRHTRPNPQRGIQGGIVEKEASLHLSNVMLWNPSPRRVIAWHPRPGRRPPGALLQVQRRSRGRLNGRGSLRWQG